MTDHRRWLIQVVVATIALVVLAFAVDLAADPWGLLEMGRWRGINNTKPRVEAYARLHKAAAVRRLAPSVVILGTSRAEAGLAPEHPALAARGAAYNLALPNAQIGESFAYLRYAQETHPLRLVVVGLDFFAFNPGDTGEPDALRTMRSATGRLAPFLTLDMLKDSAATLAAQWRGEPDFVDAGGRSTVAMWSRMERQRGGAAGLARGDRDQYESNMYHFAADGFASATGRRPIEVLRELLAYAAGNGIEVKLFISPGHAEDLETIDRLGLWPLYEQWKRELAAIAAAAGATLWDFSGYTPYTTEPLGAAATQWWWGAAHYKRELGDLLLDRLFGAPVPADLGAIVTPRNIEAHLAAIRRDRGVWRDTQR